MIVDGPESTAASPKGVGIALMELISFDEEGQKLPQLVVSWTNLIPTALELPRLRARREPWNPLSPTIPLGAKGVGRVAQTSARRRPIVKRP